MTRQVIVDTGPLVAMLDADEEHHLWTIDQLKTIRLPLLTCEAVIAETCFLLRRHPRAVAQVGSLVDEGKIESQFALKENHERVFKLMRKYQDLPMSFADACLVCMIENIPRGRIFTLDSDFQTYRQSGRRIIPTIAPSGG